MGMNLMEIMLMELNVEKELMYIVMEINILEISKIMFKKGLVKNISKMVDIMKENLEIMKQLMKQK